MFQWLKRFVDNAETPHFLIAQSADLCGFRGQGCKQNPRCPLGLPHSAHINYNENVFLQVCQPLSRCRFAMAMVPLVLMVCNMRSYITPFVEKEGRGVLLIAPLNNFVCVFAEQHLTLGRGPNSIVAPIAVNGPLYLFPLHGG